MASDEAGSWIFSPECIQHKTPSRLDGISFNDELNERQKCASLIQEVAKRIELLQTVANTALCYMHRFYMYHSFKRFRFELVGPVTLFLAAKVEEQPRKLDHIIYAVHRLLHREIPANPLPEPRRLDFAETYTALESVMLQTLGFCIRFDQPHLHIVSSVQKIRGSRDLAQTAWFIATHCLHMTMFFVQYPPEVIACLCIYLACKWANVEMPMLNDKLWIHVVCEDVTIEQLETMTEELLEIIQRSPAKLKQRMASIRGSNCLPPEVAEKLGIHFDPSVNGNAANGYEQLASTLRADVDSSDAALNSANMTPKNIDDLAASGSEAQSTPNTQQKRVIDVNQYRKRYLDTTRSGGNGGPVVDGRPGWNADMKPSASSDAKHMKPGSSANNAALPQAVAMKKPRTGSLLSEVLKRDSTGRPAPQQPSGRERTTSGGDRAAVHHDKQRSHGDGHAHADSHAHGEPHPMHHTGEQRNYNKHDVYRSSQHSSGRERTLSTSNSEHSAPHADRERERDRDRDRDRERERERDRERPNDRQRERHGSSAGGREEHSYSHGHSNHNHSGSFPSSSAKSEIKPAESKHDAKPHDLPVTVPKQAPKLVRNPEDEMEEGEISDDE